jgi:hypothetical protein
MPSPRSLAMSLGTEAISTRRTSENTGFPKSVDCGSSLLMEMAMIACGSSLRGRRFEYNRLPPAFVSLIVEVDLAERHLDVMAPVIRCDPGAIGW